MLPPFKLFPWFWLYYIFFFLIKVLKISFSVQLFSLSIWHCAGGEDALHPTRNSTSDWRTPTPIPKCVGGRLNALPGFLGQCQTQWGVLGTETNCCKNKLEVEKKQSCWRCPFAGVSIYFRYKKINPTAGVHPTHLAITLALITT